MTRLHKRSTQNSKLDFIVERISYLHTDVKENIKQTQEIAISVAKNTEHLKGMNGKVQRHETNIDALDKKANANQVSIAKGGTAGAAGGTLILVVWEGIKRFMSP